MSTSRLRRGIGAKRAIDVVEAAYSLDGTEAEWLDRILATAWLDIDTGCGTYAFTGNEEVPNLDASPAFAQRELDVRYAARLETVNRDAPQDVFALLRRELVTCGGLVQTLGANSPVVVHFREVVSPVGVEDGFSLFARDAAGGSVSLSAPAREVLEIAPRVRGIWRRIGLHLASGLRLRRKLAASTTVRDALFDPSGRIRDAHDTIKDDEGARGVLTRAVLGMEKARRADVRSSPDDALSLWRGLVAGEWSLVDHWESGGRRYLAAYRNRPDARDPRALTPTERSVLRYLGMGAANKDIMYALGLPAGTVAAAVTQLFKKLRVKRRVDLALIADPSRLERVDVGTDIGVLSADARPSGEAAASLSSAEHAVAVLVVRGWSNAKIARERKVSERTVSNQIKAIYEKIGVTSRSQLALALRQR
jgi:DNA-binding NarL/FixJ family response regulator